MRIQILNVEDDPVVADLISALIEQSETFELQQFADAEAALAALRAGARADIMLFDIHLPRMSGLDLVREVRRLPAHARTPILMTTTSGDEASLVSAFSLGATDYLTKPINPHDFLARLRVMARIAEVQSLPLRAVTRSDQIEGQLHGLLETYRAPGIFLNFIASMSRVDSARTQIVSFALTDTARWRTQIAPESIDWLCTALGASLASLLPTTNCLVTLLGESVFVGVVDGRHTVDPDQLQARFEAQLRARLPLDWRHVTPPTVVAAQYSGAGVFAKQGGGALTRALQMLDRKAETLGLEVDLDPVRAEIAAHAEALETGRRVEGTPPPRLVLETDPRGGGPAPVVPRRILGKG